jgi:hypothetical protein
MLGYLPSEVSTNPLGKPVAERMAAGFRYYCRLTAVTGVKTRGANIQIAVWTGSVDTQPTFPPEFGELPKKEVKRSKEVPVGIGRKPLGCLPVVVGLIAILVRLLR